MVNPISRGQDLVKEEDGRSASKKEIVPRRVCILEQFKSLDIACLIWNKKTTNAYKKSVSHISELYYSARSCHAMLYFFYPYMLHRRSCLRHLCACVCYSLSKRYIPIYHTNPTQIKITQKSTDFTKP